MSHNHLLREQLDAFREEADLARPEMQGLANELQGNDALAKELSRRQRFDRAVAGGLTDVEVPAGLTERIVNAVQEAELDAQSREVSPVLQVPRKRAWRALLASRKLWSAMATAAAVLLMAAAGGFYWHRSQQIFEQQQIASALNGFQMADGGNRSARGLPGGFVLPPLPVKPQRYLPFKTAEGWSAVAVDCTTTTGHPATLIIVQQPSQFRLGGSPVTHLATAGKKVAAWREGRLLYVLVEEVSKPRAGAMLRRGAAPPA